LHITHFITNTKTELRYTYVL